VSRSVSKNVQLVLDTVYSLFQERGSWPTFAVLDRRLDQAGLDAESVLRSVRPEFLAGVALWERSYQPDDEIALSLEGVGRATGSEQDLAQLARFVRWLAEQEQAHDPDARGGPLNIEVYDALVAIGVPPGSLTAESVGRRLSRLIDLVPGAWSGKTIPQDSPWWTLTVTRGIRRYRGVADAAELAARVSEAIAPSGTGRPSISSLDSEPAPAGEPETIEAYDVALSYAGEERAYVERVAARLRALGVAVFYDRFETVELWGTNLVDRFADVYGQRARYVVMFVSKAYAEKAWTDLERRQAQANALAVRRELVLPVRFDETTVPGLAATVHYLSAKDYEPEALADVIAQKVRQVNPTIVVPAAGASMSSLPVAGGAHDDAAPAAAPEGHQARADVEAWSSGHRARALEGLAKLGATAYFEVTANVSPALDMPSQRRLADAVAAKNIDTFGWPIGVSIASQPPKPIVDGIVTEIPWAERGSYDYWALSRAGMFYLLKTLSEDVLEAPGKLYFNTRIVRVAETVMFLSALYQELGAPPNAHIRLEIVHSGIAGRVLSAVGRRRGTFIDRRTTEDRVASDTTFRLGDVDARLVDIVRELSSPLFMVYEYLEVADTVYADLVEQFRAGQVT